MAPLVDRPPTCEQHTFSFSSFGVGFVHNSGGPPILESA